MECHSCLSLNHNSVMLALLAIGPRLHVGPLSLLILPSGAALSVPFTLAFANPLTLTLQPYLPRCCPCFDILISS